MSARAGSLTGVWHGLYSYPREGGSVSFVATLIENGTSVSGTTHEPCQGGGILFATLMGSRHCGVVSFTKTYEGANPLYGRVAYEGRLSGDHTEIEGRWTIPGAWSGKFLMIRPAGKEAEVARKAVLRA
jgi:hypothetical protein